MSKKVIVASIILALILAAGFGIYYLLGYSQKTTIQEIEIKESKEPLAKLVYVGTNETLSEALYHLDLQDGKLDEPHIVHRILEYSPDGMIYKQSLLFISLNGKIKREEIFIKNFQGNTSITLSKNGRYALVHDYIQEEDAGIEKNKYYDIEGKLLWDAGGGDIMSPDGEYLIGGIPGFEHLIVSQKRTYTLYNSRGKIIKQINIELGKETYGETVVAFSQNSKYCLIIYAIGGVTSEENRLILFDDSGKVLFDKHIKGFEINNYNMAVLNDGKVILDAMIEKPKRIKITKILSNNGEDIYVEKGTRSISVSPNNKYILIEKKHSVSVMSLPDIREIYNISIIGLTDKGGQLGVLEISNNGNIYYSKDKENILGSDKYYIQEYFVHYGSNKRKFFERREKEYSGMNIHNNYLFISLDFPKPGEQSYKGKEIFIFKLE